jgi:hypothetical protein
VGLLGKYLKELTETDAVKEKLLTGPLAKDLRDLGISSKVGALWPETLRLWFSTDVLA